jgi:hypothetical protein
MQNPAHLPQSAQENEASVIQTLTRREQWIPAFAGMTRFKAGVPGIVIPAKAGIHWQCLNRRNEAFSCLQRPQK